MMRVDKVWGYEEIIINRAYCMKFLHIMKGYECSLHKHDIKDETFYVQSGQATIEIRDDPETPPRMLVARPGDTIIIPPATYHRFRGIDDTVFIEVSTHDDPRDSYRVPGQESRKVKL